MLLGSAKVMSHGYISSDNIRCFVGIQKWLIPAGKFLVKTFQHELAKDRFCHKLYVTKLHLHVSNFALKSKLIARQFANISTQVKGVVSILLGNKSELGTLNLLDHLRGWGGSCFISLHLIYPQKH